MLRTAPPLNRGARQNAAGAAGCVLRQQQYGRSELADEVAHSAVDVGLGILDGAGCGALHVRSLNKKNKDDKLISMIMIIHIQDLTAACLAVPSPEDA